MKTILKPGYEKIMRLFYIDKHAKFHLRNISRQTKLNENSTSIFLNKLQKDQILNSIKEGNLKKYFLEKNLLTFGLLSLFDIERFDRLPSIRKNAIQYFLKELKEQPIIVLLFGSTAKGDFIKNSDIDLFLVVNDKIKIKGARDYAESQTGLRINCLQITYPDFFKEIKLEGDKVMQSAINSGYPLTNHIKYYSEVLR